MPTQVQIRRGTTTEHGTFTGAAGELTVDTTKKTVVVHDGTTAGGAPLLRENGSQNAVTTGTSTAASFIPTSSTVPTNGVYLPAANSVGVATNGSARITVDSTGRVGIGTTSPGQDLDVRNTGTAAAIRVHSGTASTNTSTSTLEFLSSFSGSGVIGTARINANTPAGGQSELAFLTSPSNNSPQERARIDSSGRLLVGTSTSIETNALLQIYKASGTAVAVIDSDSLGNGEEAGLYVRGGSRLAYIAVNKQTGNTNPVAYLFMSEEDGAGQYLWVDNSGQFRISTTSSHIGTTSGTVVGAQTSDERLKNILGPVEYGLDTLKQIEPVRYTLKSEPDTEKLGFIAQQVLPLVPQSVFDTGEEIEEGEPTKLGMEYVALIPVLVNAIKELSAEVDALKAQLS